MEVFTGLQRLKKEWGHVFTKQKNVIEFGQISESMHLQIRTQFKMVYCFQTCKHVGQGCVYLAVLQICLFLSETNFRFNVKLETPQAFLILPALRYKQNRGDKDVRFISS